MLSKTLERIFNKFWFIAFLSYHWDAAVITFVKGTIIVNNNFRVMKFRLIAAVKIWLVIYPSITIFLLLFGNRLSLLPLYQRTFILSVSLVPWMLFVGMPVVDFIVGLFSIKIKK